jgi:hypothetical protein
MKYEFCETDTGKSAPISRAMAFAFVQKIAGDDREKLERALSQLQDGFCFSVDGGIVRRAPTVEQMGRDAMKCVDSTLFPVTVHVTRKEFLKLPMAIRRRSLREQAERIAAAGFQALMDEGDDE